MKIVSIALSKKKGTRKKVVNSATIIENHGLEGDAHSGDWHRQVSFLASEEIEKARKQGLDVTFGDFAENVASLGISWEKLAVGTKVKLGASVIIEITQIGKTCHNKCAIYYQAGDCIMPKKGVFARVIKGGIINCEDTITILE